MEQQTNDGNALECLKADIITGFYPPGTKLNIEKLKARYHVGACPLREALQQLTALGFVEAQHLKGFRVAQLQPQRFIETIAIRKLLELDALKKALANGSEEWEAQLVASYHRVRKLESSPNFLANPDEMEWLHCLRRFQINLLSGCNSPIQMQLIQLLFDQSDPYCYLKLRYCRNVQERIQEKINLHQKIYDTAMARDIDAACEIYAYILDHSIEILLEHWGEIIAAA